MELEEPCFMSGNRKNDNQLKNPLTEVVKERYGFTHVISNELEIVDGKLTGRVTGPFGTPIIDGRGKIS